MSSAHCHYCGRPALVIRARATTCARCVDLPRLEPSAMRDRPLLRPPQRGLAG